MLTGRRSLLKPLREISSPDPAKRRSAAESLSTSDERAIYPLIKALRDDNAGVQDAAMRSLISIGGEVTAYMLLPLLRDEAYLRNTATIILKEIGPDSVRLLRPLLKDRDDDIRKFAVDLVCEIKECDYPQELARVLENDLNPNVRASAAKAIGVLNYKEAAPQIMRALEDEEWVVFSALETVALMKSESFIDRVVSLLDNPSEAIRYAAIETLGEIGSYKAGRALIAHLRRTDDIERIAVVKSLIRTGDTPSLKEVPDVLIDMLKNSDWDDKLIALEGLAELKEERAVHTIVDIAGSLDRSVPPDEEKLIFVKEVLTRFGCCDALIGTLSSPAIRYRGKTVAIEVLGDLGCKDAVPHIAGLLEDSIQDIREAAARAFDKIIHGRDEGCSFAGCIDG